MELNTNKHKNILLKELFPFNRIFFALIYTYVNKYLNAIVLTHKIKYLLFIISKYLNVYLVISRIETVFNKE